MPPLPRLRFDRFEYDESTGELWLEGSRVALQPQPSRLLALLVSRPDEVVAREEIRVALWGDDVHVDFDRSLNFCVARLRAALGDNAADPRFIETLPTRGYRWLTAVGPVEDVRPKAEAPPPEPSDASRLRWVVAAAVLAVAAVVALRLYSPLTAGAPKVVVVPFHNETGAPDLDRVAKGVSDATVVKLSESDRLRVIGNATGLRLSFRPPDMKAMGESLGAQYLVLGQMKRDDRRMRIVAHLIRVSDQTHVWANTYDSETLDLSQQAAIAAEIATAVSLRIGKG